MDKRELIKNDIEAAKKEYTLYRILQKRNIDIYKRLSREHCSSILLELEERFKERIKGQDELAHQALLCIIVNEHALLEGLPGTGKTEMVKWIAQVLGFPFQRIQFIPDMLPSDLIGKDYIDVERLQQQKPDAVKWIKGPLFTGLLLADEINRAPSKVQASLLEAMSEAQITPFGKLPMMIWSPIHEAALEVWREKRGEKGLFGLPSIDPRKKRMAQFNVFATMNPIEQEGTYPLSEAQLDRFCFKINVPYPKIEAYKEIREAAFKAEKPQKYDVVNAAIVSKDDYRAYFLDKDEDMIPILIPLYFFLTCRNHIYGFFNNKGEKSLLDEFKGTKDEEKIHRIVFVSSLKNPSFEEDEYLLHFSDELQIEIGKFFEKLRKYSPDVYKKAEPLRRNKRFQYIKSGAGPRGFLYLTKVVLAEALMNYGQNIPYDVYIKRNAVNVLKHRIRLDVQAKLEGVTPEDIINDLCEAFLDI